MSTKAPFHFTFGFVTIGHVLLIATVLLMGANSCVHRKDQPDMLPVEFMVAVDDGPEMLDPVKGAEAPPEVKPPPQPPPEPEPPAAEIVPEVSKAKPKAPEPKPKPPDLKPKTPEPKPKPADVKPKQPDAKQKPSAEKAQDSSGSKIAKGRRITAPNSNPPNAATKRLTPEEIARLLSLGATAGNRNLTPVGEALDYEVIRRRLYKAWAQPGSAASNLSAEVEIRMNSAGTIISRRMLRASGNAVMDESVMEAVRSVLRIDGLTPGFIDRKSGRVTIVFEVNAGAA
jgi:TonB family protein